MMRVEEAALGTDTDTFARALQAEGLPIAAHYIGQCVYEYPIFTQQSYFAHAPHPCSERAYGKGLCPNAEAILKTCLTLSVHEAYTETDREETAYAIRRVAAWFAGD
jgi:dTDP-4-amino-4,6-dideoxygalactose transaminase